MKIVKTGEELGRILDNAVDSLFDGRKGDVFISPKIQQEMFKQRFRADITGGHYSYPANCNEFRRWNIHDAIVEFEDEDAYLLFMFQWS